MRSVREASEPPKDKPEAEIRDVSDDVAERMSGFGPDSASPTVNGTVVVEFIFPPAADMVDMVGGVFMTVIAIGPVVVPSLAFQ